MKLADLRSQEKKEHYCFMCFLWQSNELLIFLLLGVSTTPLEFRSAILSQNTAGLFLFPLFSVFVFSPLDISLFMFLYPIPTVAFSSLRLSFGPVQYTLACLAPTRAACFPFSRSVLSASATSFPLQCCCLPRLLFLQWFLFKSPLSSLYIPLPSPLATPLKSFHSPFTPIPSLPLLCL